MKKAIVVLLAVCMLITLVGCPAINEAEPADDEEQASEPASEPEEPFTAENTEEVEEEQESEVDVTENVDISGTFISENGTASLMFYEESGNWFVEGSAMNKSNDTGKVNLGSISGHIKGQGTDYIFDDGNGQMTFSFAQDALSLTAETEDDAYFCGNGVSFNGTYYLSSGDDTLMYYDAENAGYMAAAMYLSGMSEDGGYSYAAGDADNDYALKFISNFVDLCYSGSATEVEGLTQGVSYYPFDENYMNIVLNTAFSCKFGTDKLMETTESGIVYNANLYYVPVNGGCSGTVEFAYDHTDMPTCDGVIDYKVNLAKADGSSYSAVLSVTLSPGDGESAYTITGIEAAL